MGKSEVNREAFEVYLDAADLGIQQKVGTLYRSTDRTDLPAPFQYDESWLGSSSVFMLDPRLELWRGELHPPPNAPAFGIFMDSAPDRWGRLLMERREAAQALRERRKMRALQELDFLFGVHDLTRIGALRFRSAAGGPFLDNSPDAVPPVASLRHLAELSRKLEEPGVEDLPQYEQWLAMLIAPGTSLGGSRPKANFSNADGSLWIAKFPAHEDRYDIGAWEYVVHRLAKRADIWVPASHLELLTDRYRTFCVSRFDRTKDGRRMFASATTLLERQDGDKTSSYLDLVAFISDQGAAGHVDGDLAQLFRRVVFNVLIGNRDDHLRNHGFIRQTSGWRLAPAYDMNPNPYKSEHALTLDGKSAAPNLDVVRDTAEYYRLGASAATNIIDAVKTVVATWPEEATKADLHRSERAIMERVFLV